MLEPDWNYGSGPVLVEFYWYQTVTAFFSGCVFKVTKRTVENRYSLKSENVEMLLFMKYNLLRGGGEWGTP